jgi:hypothetical protein
MALDELALERLFNEGESSALDYKRDQYPFASAADGLKAELLKDILAFANASRRSDAYILIGVEELANKKGHPVGVSHHLDDAAVQQFVSFKTNRPVRFSYQAVPYKGLWLGVIHIPLQPPRPFFLLKDYAQLKTNAVYIRRNTSTDLADPDEIAAMALEDAGGQGELQRAAEQSERRGRLLEGLRTGELDLAPYPMNGRRFIWKVPPEWADTQEDTYDYDLASEAEVFWLRVAIWARLPKFEPGGAGPREASPAVLYIYETNGDGTKKKRIRYKNESGWLYLTLSPRNNREPQKCIRDARYLPAGAVNCKECNRTVDVVESENQDILARMRNSP